MSKGTILTKIYNFKLFRFQHDSIGEDLLKRFLRVRFDIHTKYRFFKQLYPLKHDEMKCFSVNKSVLFYGKQCVLQCLEMFVYEVIFLQYEPKRRISAEDGLKHPYFQDLPRALFSLPGSK